MLPWSAPVGRSTLFKVSVMAVANLPSARSNCGLVYLPLPHTVSCLKFYVLPFGLFSRYSFSKASRGFLWSHHSPVLNF